MYPKRVRSWRYETDGSKKSSADVFVMMTQDAMPKDDRLIENWWNPCRGSGGGLCETAAQRGFDTGGELYQRI